MIADSNSTLWLGDHPSEWRKTRIKRVSEFSPSYSGGKPESDEECTVIPMEAVSEYGVVSAENQETFDDVTKGLTLFEKGDVLFAKITPCMENGKGAYIENLPTRYAFGSTEFHVMRPSHEIDGKFLYYVTFNPFFRSWAEKNMHGAAGQQRVPTRFLKYTGLPLPTFPEQKRIAAYLDASCAAIDRAVETKQKQLETLDVLRKSIIQRAVTQGLNPKVKMKIVPMDGVGLVPDHWRVKQLRYVCQISYGITLQLESGKTDGVPILTVQNLDIHGDWKFDNKFCIDEELVHDDDILKHGDLLFNWRNGSARHVGKTAFFNLEGRYTHVSFLLRMRCGRDLSPFYLKSYLGALRMAGFFEGSKDKVNKTFNSTELNRLSVLVPPVAEQEEIVAIVQEKSAEIENVRKVIENQ
nr:restriction endonuclease subunit S [Synergistaceae bacterium]